MQPDASHLADFYEQPLGQAARRLIARRLRQVWPGMRNLRLLGFGFTQPYLKPYLGEAERVAALMPAQMGIAAWPAGRPLTALGEEDAFPFPDAFFDRILVVHGLEGAEAARVLMRQLWRVLAPEGRMVIVVPNRASFWAQVEISPFASGRPFHRSELDALLRAALFEPTAWDRALYLPPFAGRRLARTAPAWERIGRRVLPGLAGVHLVEAAKSLYGTASLKRAGAGERALASVWKIPAGNR